MLLAVYCESLTLTQVAGYTCKCERIHADCFQLIQACMHGDVAEPSVLLIITVLHIVSNAFQVQDLTKKWF